MSATRKPDESFADFKTRQKQEARAAKLAPYMCNLEPDGYRKLPTGQLVTQEGITRGRARSMKYAAKRAANKGKKS